jgi:hypothetical protein
MKKQRDADETASARPKKDKKLLLLACALQSLAFLLRQAELNRQSGCGKNRRFRRTIRQRHHIE